MVRLFPLPPLFFWKREDEMATMREEHVTTRGAQKGRRKKTIAARFRRKSPDLASREWLFLKAMDDPIERTLPLFSTRKRERFPGGRTMTQRWRAGSTHNRQRVGGVA